MDQMLMGMAPRVPKHASRPYECVYQLRGGDETVRGMKSLSEWP